jgi:sugar O-acyltransferase (sialic acid O-acetyltransferase NeuD family)
MSPNPGSVSGLIQQSITRALDVLAGAIGLVVLSPAFIVVALRVRRDLGPPIFFRQSRPGLHGKPFQMLKFRTMQNAIDDQGNPLPDADRLTDFGRFLRRSSLDELPELWNVIRGDMSLVGPRPLLMEYLDHYTPEQMRRHEVKPGITGWAQVNGRNAISWQEKFAYDVRLRCLVRRQSIALAGPSHPGDDRRQGHQARRNLRRRCRNHDALRPIGTRNAMIPLWIIGSGGHAKVAIDTARSSGQFDVIGCLDENPGRIGHDILGVPIIGPINDALLKEHRIDHAFIAIGSNQARRSFASRFDNRLAWTTLIHQQACVAESARIGSGTLVCAGTVIQPDAVVGNHVIVNTGATVDHDCSLGDFAHVAPGSHLAGMVSIGEGTLIGLGSGLIPGVSVGEWAIVGAGTVVTGDLPANVTAVGAPAKVIDVREPGWTLD